MTTLLDEPRPARRRRLWQLALAPCFAIAIGKNACIHSFCHPERSSVEGPPALVTGDDDSDGLLDAEEEALARRFAPVVILDRADEYRPASISWLLARTNIFHEAPKTVLAGSAKLSSSAASLPKAVHGGSDDPRDWTTYVHVYPREDGGINVQYWFYYPYSNGPLLFDHDSDWEHVTIKLNREREPVGAYLAQHENDHSGRFHAWSELTQLDGQPVVYSARGTHATYARPEHVAWFERAPDCPDPRTCQDLLWKTWEGGGLENLGERGSPMRLDRALSFSQRWGGSGLVPGTSAPYGPLYHRGFCVDGVRNCLDDVKVDHRLLVGSNGMLTSSAAATTSHIAP